MHRAAGAVLSIVVLASAACGPTARARRPTAAVKPTTPVTTGAVPTSATAATARQAPQPLDVFFIDAERGWGLVADCAASCTLAVDGSSDGGASFSRLSDVGPFSLAEDRAQVAFADALDGYVAISVPGPAEGGPASPTSTALYATHDGGRSWAPSPAPGPVIGVYPGAPDDWLLTGTCGSDDVCHDQLAVSADHGRTWQARATLPPVSHPGLTRAGATGWVLGAALVAPLSLLASDDDGAHWSTRLSPCPPAWSAALAVVGQQDLWLACGAEPGAGEQLKSIFRSRDGGHHWDLVAADAYGQFPATGAITPGGYVGLLAAGSDRQAWLALNRGGIVATSDGGVTWADQPSSPEPENFFFALEFMDSQTGWVGVSNTFDPRGNGVYRTTDGGKTWGHASLP